MGVNLVLRAKPNVDALAQLGRGDPRICIAILDGPVDYSHPCFSGAKLAQLQTLVTEVCPDEQALGHGTHVASIIFGQPGSAVCGIAPQCSGLVVPIFSANIEASGLVCSQLDLARAILLAMENGAHIINISGGQLTSSGEPEPILAQAVERCAKNNVLIVAAAGNDGCECLHVPAAAPSVLAVGAMDNDGRPLESSNWGSVYRSQGILAPGFDVLGAVPGGGTTRKSGTSFAAPYVSGVIGLLASLQIKHGEPPDLHAISAALLRSATPCVPEGSDDCRRFLAGRLNLEGAVERLSQGDRHMTDAATLLASENPSPMPDHTSIPTAAHVGFASPIVEDSAVRMSGGPARAQETYASSAIHAFTAPKQPLLTARGAQAPGQVTLSDCGCGGGGNCTCGATANKDPTLVYALGRLGYDFGTEARRDVFTQAMDASANNPFVQPQLLSHLEANPYDATLLIWTLNLDATPIYAIQPIGPYASVGYDRLREALAGQLNQNNPVELISVPGVIAGSARLQSGQVVPIIVPVIRGMYSWSTKALVEHVLGPRSTAELVTGLTDFLNRIYYDLRNLGITAEERALNFSATNAVQVAEVINSATSNHLDLDSISVKKSPVCRPDSLCYDVELSFFNPDNTNVASRIFAFTIDVSDVMPVSIGTVRSYARR